MKKLLFPSIIAIAILASSMVVIEHHFNGSDRDSFEEYLLSIAKDFKVRIDQKDDEKKKFADDPDVAAFQDYLKTVDPETKRVPFERLIEAYETTKKIQQDQAISRSADYSMIWSGSPANMGGRTRAFMMDPNDPAGQKAWAGGVTGGLWYNDDVTNDQSSWVPADDFWPSLAINSICSDPNDPMTFYVGTGEAQTAMQQYRSSCGLGIGILKSIDGGLTWNILIATEEFKFITDIVVRDENGSSVIYAGVSSGLYMEEQHISMPSDGLFRSTDGGLNWQQVFPDIDGFNVPYIPSDIEIASDGRIWIGSFPNIDSEGGGIILYSDEGTAGSWTIYDDYKTIIEQESPFNVPGRVMLSSCKSFPNVVYAAIASGAQGGFMAYECYHIIHTFDTGQNWQEYNIPDGYSTLNWAYIAWHALVISVDPNDPETVWCGGLDVHRSTDWGQNWTTLTDWTLMYSGGGPDYVHGDIHRIEFYKGTSDDIIFSTDGGIFETDMGTEPIPVFFERNNSYNTLQYYTCALTPDAGEQLTLGGCQDNCTLYYDGQPITVEDVMSGGDGAYCFIDKNESNIWLTSYQYNRYFIYVNGNVVASINNFALGNFICPADYDYMNNALYANVVSFFGIYNKNSLLKISDIPNGNNAGLINVGTSTNMPFTHIKYSPYSTPGTSTLFLGTQSGEIYKVENAESNPVAIDLTGTNLPIAYISGIDVHGSEDTVLMCFSNYGIESLWQTCDGGNTWVSKEGNLPDMPVRWVLYHPENANQALLATELGVWATTNLQQSDVYWEPVNDGMANVRIDMLRLRESDNKVVAASHGRGLFYADFTLAPVGIQEKEDDIAEFDLYPNPAETIINCRLPAGRHGFHIPHPTFQILIYDLKGTVEEIVEVPQDNQEVRIDVSEFAKGTYVAVVKSGKEVVGKAKFIKK